MRKTQLAIGLILTMLIIVQFVPSGTVVSDHDLNIGGDVEIQQDYEVEKFQESSSEDEPTVSPQICIKTDGEWECF